MKFLSSFLIGSLLISTLVYARTHHKPVKQLRVAVIDSGLDLNDYRLTDHLCNTGHKDFSGEGLVDLNGHGTTIAGLIEEYAGDGNYCLVIYKYLSSTTSDYYNQKNEVAAIAEAVKNNFKLVNISSGGPGFDEKEYDLIRLHPKTVFVVAAGNNGRNLNRDCYYFPACYLAENEQVIGNLSRDGLTLSPSSNYGRALTASEIGENVPSMLPGDRTGRTSGTSMATAIHMGKLIREMLDAK